MLADITRYADLQPTAVPNCVSKKAAIARVTGLLALPMAAPAGAAAASFSDLPSSHWAYIAMTEAAGYGILQGTGANTMSPSAPLYR